MHSAKVRCIWLPIKRSHGLMNTLALLMMGNRERLNTLNPMACSVASVPFPMCILAHGTGTLCSCCHYRFGARPGWDPVVKSAICTSELRPIDFFLALLHRAVLTRYIHGPAVKHAWRVETWSSARAFRWTLTVGLCRASSSTMCSVTWTFGSFPLRTICSRWRKGWRRM